MTWRLLDVETPGFTGTLIGNDLTIGGLGGLKAGQTQKIDVLVADGKGTKYGMTITVRVKKQASPFAASAVTILINTSFPRLFQRTLYDVVRYDPSTAGHIPGGESGAPGGLNLEQFFGSAGFICASTKARTDLNDYGFLPIKNCGTTS